MNTVEQKDEGMNADEQNIIILQLPLGIIN